MFAPDPYFEPDVIVAQDLIEEIWLGTIVTAAPALMACHVPFMIDRAGRARGTLIGHVDRRNPQWQAIEATPEVLVTFLGPDAYVSPTWYGTRPRVPTWLYASVHVYGRPHIARCRSSSRRSGLAESLTVQTGRHFAQNGSRLGRVR